MADKSDNLVPLNERTKTEQRRIATAGGKASGVARRQKRTMREVAEMVATMELKEPAVFDMELAFIAGLNWHSLSAIKEVSDNLNLEQYERSTK